jgi:uncharacterized protein YbbC (DUF1343 family)
MRLGLEALLDDPRAILGEGRVGLICHPASVDHRYRHAADLFHAHDDINLTTLFGPQHGIWGQTQDDMIEWEGFTDARTGLPVYSLYGAHRTPTPAMLSDTDILVVDLQDVGTRIYTFVSTMALAMQAARGAGIRVVVLDRPNPINGVQMDGNLLEAGHESFVGMYPLPTRHGMTVGELARMFNEEFGIGCDLTVVPMEGWRRAMWHDESGAPWVFPSPNIPTLDSATVFPGAVHVEGTTISEGRGTTRPFELIGAPHIDPHALAAALAREELPGVIFRPCFFEPTFQKHAGAVCGGVQLHVTERDRFPAALAGIAVLRAMIAQDPSTPLWKEPPYEYVHDRFPFDVIAGTRTLREQLTEQISLADIAASWQPGLDSFAEQRQAYLLYE